MKQKTTYFFFLCLLLLAACGQPPAPKHRLNISFHSFPSTADPGKTGDFISGTLICMIYEGLTRCLPSGNVELALAESVDISSDELTYLFHLRPSYWTNQEPVTAYDFERSWKRILNPASRSLSAYLFYPILNAEAAYQGLKSAEEIGVKALDANTLQVVLERRASYFLSLTAFPCYLPYHADAEEFVPAAMNGPFLIESVKQNNEIVLKKNPLYWNPKAIYLEEIFIAIVGHESTALNMFLKGELDWIGGAISPIPVDALPKKADLHFHPMAATTFCAFNTTHPLLSNRCLRQALSLSINRTAIIKNITQMGELPATRCIPPSLIGSRNKTIYQPHDPELAKLYFNKALEQLGVEQLTLTLSFSATQKDSLLAQALQRQWKETLGVDVELKAIETGCFKSQLHARNFEMALSFWIAQYSDPVNILERFEDPENFKNYSGWRHIEFCSLMQQVHAERDPLLRFCLIEQAEQMFLAEMPLAPIFHWSNAYLCHPRVRNLHSTPNGGVLFEHCWLK